MDVTRTLLTRTLAGLRRGGLSVRWRDGARQDFAGPEPGPQAELVVLRPGLGRRVMLGGGLGLAEAYLDGLWTTPDLVALLDLLATNRVAGAIGRTPAVLRPVARLSHLLRANTRRGSRRNIAYHYDLGNDFYRLWLDPTMAYSCALFSRVDGARGLAPGSTAAPPDADTLERAQVAKWERLLDLLEVAAGQHLLEIGCGWGGFAVHAAKTRDCRITGITLSAEQLCWAQELVEGEGLNGQVQLRLQDYRDVEERFDGIVSIEMFEAVGERFWPVFFARVRDCLKRDGRAALQVITVADERFEAYRRGADFIQRYIFPGGLLPGPAVFRAAAEEAGLQVGEPAFFAADYACTLGCWLESFDAAHHQVRAQGFDERFVRMWRYYLASCIAGFRNGMIDDMQVVLSRQSG